MSDLIECRTCLAADWASAAGWMMNHYSKPFPQDFLPETGIIALVNGIRACVIPVYLENSSTVAVLGHCMINEKLVKRQIVQAVEACMRAAVSFAATQKKKYVIALFGRNSINRLADKCGFVTADRIEEKFYYIGE